MTKKQTDPSFWETSVVPQDWEGITQYIKPRKLTEIVEFFSPKVPDPDEQPAEPDKRERTFLEQLCITPDEFIELAFQKPEIWEEDELDYLQQVASEGFIDERLDELAKEYFYGNKKPKEKYKTAAPIEREDAEFALPILDVPSINAIPDLDVLEGTVNIDNWWEKK